MGYELTQSEAHRMVCENAPTCTNEMLGHSKDALVEDLTLSGWVFQVLDGDGNPTYVCKACTTNPPSALPDATYAPATPVKQGDPVFSDAGDVVGHYARDSDGDEEVPVTPVPPEPPPAGPTDHGYADMLAGSDPDDDARGQQSAVAPSPAGDADATADETDDPFSDLSDEGGHDVH